MLDITVVAFGKIKTKYFDLAAGEYLKRLKPYARIRIEELKLESFSQSSQEVAKKEEGNRLQDYLNRKSGSAVFLLAEKGEECDSIKFSKKLFNLNQPIILIIGGTLGFTEEIFNKYNKISLSKLTFPHELARVILLEQIYRAVTIFNNKSYHY